MPREIIRKNSHAKREPFTPYSRFTLERGRDRLSSHLQFLSPPRRATQKESEKSVIGGTRVNDPRRGNKEDTLGHFSFSTRPLHPSQPHPARSKKAALHNLCIRNKQKRGYTINIAEPGKKYPHGGTATHLPLPPSPGIESPAACTTHPPPPSPRPTSVRKIQIPEVNQKKKRRRAIGVSR